MLTEPEKKLYDSLVESLKRYKGVYVDNPNHMKTLQDGLLCATKRDIDMLPEFLKVDRSELASVFNGLCRKGFILLLLPEDTAYVKDENVSFHIKILKPEEIVKRRLKNES